jgi:3-hydroxyisobutyrate dehydrogenase-like beta-hydroxyacid dehydrogenase
VTPVGYLGVGEIGEVIAGNALAAGFDLMVYDLRSEPLERLRARGAKIASSARALGAHAEILECSIAGDERIERALFDPNGAVEGLRSGSVIALHSTMNPDTVRRIAERARPRGVAVIDAAVSGGRQGAQARSLTYMLGGDPAAIARCRPVFASSGSRFYELGPTGAGASAKLAQQVMTVMNLVGVSESLRLARAAGLNLDAFLDMVHDSTGASHAASHWRDRWAGLPQAHADGLFDGLIPALEMARAAGVAIPLTALAQQLVRSAFS